MLTTTGCATNVPETPKDIEIPTLEAFAPVPPVLEQVPQGSAIPVEMLRNYSLLIQYVFDLEDYVLELEKYCSILTYIISDTKSHTTLDFYRL
jgi:hypothetical protein